MQSQPLDHQGNPDIKEESDRISGELLMGVNQGLDAALFRSRGQGRENRVFGYVVYMLVRNMKASRTRPPLQICLFGIRIILS